MSTKGAQMHSKDHPKGILEALKRENESKESPGRSQIVELLETLSNYNASGGSQGYPKGTKGTKRYPKYHPGDLKDPQK